LRQDARELGFWSLAKRLIGINPQLHEGEQKISQPNSSQW